MEAWATCVHRRAGAPRGHGWGPLAERVRSGKGGARLAAGGRVLGDARGARPLWQQRMERAPSGEDAFRGREGPLRLERGPARGPLFERFFTAAQEAGYSLTEDVNGECQEGFGRFDRNLHRGLRQSASRSYLHPVWNRPNLTVQSRSHATRVRLQGTRAVGVEYVHKGREMFVGADEIICSGGAINSPQLLQLSGIGPADLLREVGVEVVQNLPGVGANLQDHLVIAFV